MGMLHWQIIRETGKSRVYAAFLTNLFKHYTFQVNNMRVIHDNSPIHKTAEVQEVFDSALFHHRSEFLPPYSPQLNMIESVFSQMQSHVNNYITDIESDDELIERIEAAANSITRDDCARYYNHVTGYYVKCRDINYFIE